MMNRTFRLLLGIVTTLLAILLIYTGATGGLVLVGVGIGYLVSTFFSQDKMAEVVEYSLNHGELLFFRVFQLLSIPLIFMEGYAIIGMFALLSLIFTELLYLRKKQ